MVEKFHGLQLMRIGQEGVDIGTFWYGGALANNDTRGSSLVGDGLARNYIFISRYKK